MKRILILTASFGDGHNAAAFALRDAFQALTPRCEVEVLDLFERAYGRFNTVMKKGYVALVRHAPRLWSCVFALFDNPGLFGAQMKRMTRLRVVLRETLERMRPDIVLSTYPVYAHALSSLYPDERPFSLVTVITDSLSVCSAWFGAPSDLFLVANQPTANVLLSAGVPRRRVKTTGFPVSPQFARSIEETPRPANGIHRPKVLCVVNTGRALAVPFFRELLEVPGLCLTITTGRNSSLEARLRKAFSSESERVKIIGWTNRMPFLLMSHDLVITKAGGAIVQEAIAARCPIVINEVIPGQEEGNARLVEMLGIGVVAEKSSSTPALVREALADGGKQLAQWRENLLSVSSPDAASRIAELLLAERRPNDLEPLALRSKLAPLQCA